MSIKISFFKQFYLNYARPFYTNINAFRLNKIQHNHLILSIL
ncbi:Hypothetical protein MCYN_0751 [Mycoplasmopsis cynos C142]|uniref:Uncharacterized protein n=1 Tax=Mycoplasmopsis cynos (strain C142) TaxID=1246955 RepID=L0RV06_MYCC1|nr:Hypothetical protein MCYN_0751 [Mycoplasmopsis cynos C142]